jgi:hypothetical protein
LHCAKCDFLSAVVSGSAAGELAFYVAMNGAATPIIKKKKEKFHPSFFFSCPLLFARMN